MKCRICKREFEVIKNENNEYFKAFGKVCYGCFAEAMERVLDKL